MRSISSGAYFSLLLKGRSAAQLGGGQTESNYKLMCEQGPLINSQRACMMTAVSIPKDQSHSIHLGVFLKKMKRFLLTWRNRYSQFLNLWNIDATLDCTEYYTQQIRKRDPRRGEATFFA